MSELKGPCEIDCPNRCQVPEGRTLVEVPRPRQAWADVITCPHSDDGCERAFMVVRAPLVGR